MMEGKGKEGKCADRRHGVIEAPPASVQLQQGKDSCDQAQMNQNRGAALVFVVFLDLLVSESAVVAMQDIFADRREVTECLEPQEEPKQEWKKWEQGE